MPTTRQPTPRIVEEDDLGPWWEAFRRVDECAGFYHRPDYLHLVARHRYPGARPELFLLEKGEDLVYFPYLRRPLGPELVDSADHSDLVSSWYYGGPVATQHRRDLREAFDASFRDHCRQGGVVSEFLRFDPYLRNEWLAHNEMETVEERQVFAIELQRSEEEVLGSYPRKTQRRIERAIEAGLTVHEGATEAEIEEFAEIYRRRMEEVQASAGYRFGLDFFQELLRLPGVALHLIRDAEGRLIGGGIVVGHGRIAHEYLRATERRTWSSHPNELLVHRSALATRAAGFEALDLQGGRSGVEQFKRRFSPAARPFVVGRAIHDRRLYAELTDRSGPVDKGFFPAYRERDVNRRGPR